MEAVFAGGRLRLEDGTEVRLAGVEVPGRASPGGPEAAMALAGLVEGERVALLYGGPRRDGFGRAVAHVRTAQGRRWVQGALLDAGLARVRTRAEDRALATEMLVREAGARRRGRGLWAAAAWRVRLPDEVAPGFVLVEGRAGRAERTRSGTTLRLPGRRRTVRLETARRTVADLEAAGRPIDGLSGRLLRVRGVARPVWGGAAIRIDHPEQVERLREP